MANVRILTNPATKILNGFPPHPSPLPRGKRVKLENPLQGRGDNRKKIHSNISDRVKYRASVRKGFTIGESLVRGDPCD